MTSLSSYLGVCRRGGPQRFARALHRAAFPLRTSTPPTAALLPIGKSARTPIKLRPQLASCVNGRRINSCARFLAADKDASSVGHGAQKRPKAVIFDLGGVVVPSPQPIFDRFEEKHSLKVGSIIRAIKAAGEDGAFARLERGELTVEAFAEPFSADYERVIGVAMSVELVREFMKQLVDFTKMTPNLGVMEIIKRLRSEGVKVAILTNNFVFDNGRTVFPQQQLGNVDVVSKAVCYMYM